MAFGVFIHRHDTEYKDLPVESYQFPATYLARARACVGGWIVYLEPRRVARARGYFAVAKVAGVVPDPDRSGMWNAILEPGSFLDFAQPVPFSDADGPVERGLINASGQLSGNRQAAIRALASKDFHRIVERGLAEDVVLMPRTDDAPVAELRDAQTPWDADVARDRVPMLGSRVVRDRVFRKVVLTAYDERCALTGLKLINGGGRAEAAAAHIRPVEANGPDIVSNGLALSGTAHWMFDRGLIALADDLTILISRQVNDVASVHQLLRRSGRASSPERAADRPHPQFLHWHREHCFKQ